VVSCFTPEERAPTTHWRRGWVGPRASLDTEVKRKSVVLLHPACSLVTVLTELPWAKGKIPTPARNQSSAIQPIYQIYWQIVVKGSSVRWWQQLEHIRKKSARTRDIVGNTLAWNYTSQKVFIMFLKFSCRIWCSCTTFRILLLVHIYDIQHFITAIYFYWFSTVQ